MEKVKKRKTTKCEWPSLSQQNSDKEAHKQICVKSKDVERGAGCRMAVGGGYQEANSPRTAQQKVALFTCGEHATLGGQK